MAHARFSLRTLQRHLNSNSEVGSHSVRGVVVLAEGVAARRKREEKRYFAKRHGLVLVVEMVCTRSRNARSAVQA